MKQKKKMKISKKKVSIALLAFVLFIGIIVGVIYGLQSNERIAKKPSKINEDTIKQLFDEAANQNESAASDIEDYKLSLATHLRRDRSFLTPEDEAHVVAMETQLNQALEIIDLPQAEEAINAIAYTIDKYDITSGSGEMTYRKGILIANKQYCMPYDFSPGENPQAKVQMRELIAAAGNEGIYLEDFSTYRGAAQQESLFNRYVAADGEEEAARYSSRPGCSDHQTGMAFDIGGIHDKSRWAETTFDGTTEANWLAEHAHEYGFIIRYPQGKEDITGYMYESWHYRYVGDMAPKIKASGLSLEEYLGLV